MYLREARVKSKQKSLLVVLLAMSLEAPAQNEKQTKQVYARAIPTVPGAVICRDHRTVELMIDWYRSHFEDKLQDALTKGQSRLIRGEPTSKPPLESYGCALAPAGTPLKLEIGNVVPVVTATLPDGSTVRGVTDPGLITR